MVSTDTCSLTPTLCRFGWLPFGEKASPLCYTYLRLWGWGSLFLYLRFPASLEQYIALDYYLLALYIGYQLLSWFGKYLSHTLSCLSWCLEVAHLSTCCILPCFLLPDHPLLLQVNFISHYYYTGLLVCVGFYLVNPPLQVEEGLLVGDIEDQNCHNGTNLLFPYFL